MIDSLIRDILFGIRLLLKSPGFTFVAVLSLALGIGVNSTVFSFINAILFKTISVPNKDGLVYVFAGNPRNPYGGTSYENYLEFRKQNNVFSDLAAYAAPPLLLTVGEVTQELTSEVVSGNYFSAFDVPMQRGQAFTTAHDNLGSTEPSVVISDSFWRRRLNTDPDVVGKQLMLNGNSFTVIGVASPTFTGTDPTNSTDVWIPITQWATMLIKTAGPGQSEAPDNSQTAQRLNTSDRLGSGHNWLAMAGRLRSGMSLEQAQSVMATIASRLKNSNQKDEEPLKVTLSPVSNLHPALLETVPSALFIMALTGLILMICCVNVASLMLSRAAARQKEFGIRLALGSSRGRLVRQLLTEALLLSICGGMLGLLFAFWTTKAVMQFIPPGDLSFSAGVSIDKTVLFYSFLASVVTSLIFGLFPALQSLRPDVVKALGAAGMSFGTGRKKINLRHVLVVIQIVASLVLLISSGLFLRGFQKGEAITDNLGTHRYLVLNLSPTKYGYSVKYTKPFYRELLTRIGSTPGVDAVTLTNVLPLSMERSNVGVKIDGRESISMSRSVVAEGFFQTLNIPIVAGREFSPADDDPSRKVVIVNETFARTYWPGESALGKTIKIGQPHEIVGIVKDNPYNSVGEPYLYVWLYQRLDENVSLMMRTSAEPKAMIGGVQRAITELGGNLPIFDFKTLDEMARNQLVALKGPAGLLSLLSVIGLVVASIGIYGVTSYAFSQRRREIGIRMSFGAQRSDIMKLIMKEGVTLALLGIVLGVLLAAGAMQLVSGFLYGVSPVDPIVFVTVALLLGAVAVSASLLPAIAAANSNPVEALRHE
jgi:putative ABC transport system permease protein